MASWGGEWAYPRFQTYFNDRGHGNRLVGAITQLHQRIQPVYERLQTVIIECLDWWECLDRYDRPGMVLYLDLPYAKNRCNYVHQMRDPVEHAALAARLRSATCPWVVSGCDNALMRELYADNTIIPVTFVSGMEQRRGGATRLVNREVLITNIQP
jgi:DNA adenine methylase